MDRTDDVGAVATAKYFLRLHSYVLQTGDLTEWNAVSGHTCNFCDNVRKDIDRVYGGGGRLVSAPPTLDDGEVIGYDEQLGIHSVLLHYDLTAGMETDASGDTVRHIPAEDGYIVLDVIASTRGWVLLGGDAQERDPR